MEGLTVTDLDPRSALVLDLREVGRGAGRMITLDRTVPAPDHMQVALIGVTPGSPLTLTGRVESVVDGVLVTLTARFTTVGECSRCLDPITEESSVAVQELYRFPTTDARGRVIAEPSDDEDAEDEHWVQDDLIDLEPVLRDAVVLSLPIAPVCTPDCPGLCPQCGVRLADEPDHSHEVVDSRWAALGALVQQDESTHDPSGAAGTDPHPPGTHPDDVKED